MQKKPHIQSTCIKKKERTRDYETILTVSKLRPFMFTNNFSKTRKWQPSLHERSIGLLIENNPGTSLVVQWLRLHTPNAGGSGLIPGQGTRSHMPQLRVHMPQLKIPCTITKRSRMLQ